MLVVDSLGFRASQTVVITEPSALTTTLTSIDATIIGGSDGSVKATVAGGTAPYVYAWNNMAMTDSIGGLSAGTYIVTVTDANGCSIVDSALVSDPAAIVLVLNSTNVSCCEYFSSIRFPG